MHSENIIASGEYPYIIDCETLLSQYEYDLEDNANLEVINDHILRLFAIGILPTKGFDNNVEGKGVDVSGLGGGQEEIYPTKVLVPINVYTDEMRFEYKYDAVIKANENLPKFKNKTITYHNYKNDIIQGFDDALNFVYRNRKEIIELIENTFQNLLVRQLTKSTAVYGDLLTFADHPHYLSDSKHLEKLFENNWANPYKDKRIVPYEVNDMLNMDIPIFFCNTSKNHIITSNYEYIEDYFPKSGLEITISRLKKLNMKEVNKEKLKLRILLGNYYELIDERDKKMPEISYQEDYLNKEKIFDTCNKIAYKIMDLCYYSKSGKYVSWPYIDTTDGFYKITSIENGLYSGRAGILLFLNYLSKYTTDRNIIEFTEKVKNTTKDYGIYHHHGVFSGSLGEAYVLLKCNIDDPTYFKKLYSRYSKNSKYSKNNTYTGIDWLGGGASLVKLLDNNQNILTSKSLLYEEIAKIITTIKSNLDMFLEKESSIGMGHGGIGILYAMLIAQNKYGINCEKDIEKILDHTLNQIKDLNYYKNDYIHSKNHTSWCHGTTGLGIGAVACLKYLNDDRLVHFKELALRQAINDSNQNMSLCHGLSGNLDFLITCSLLSPQDRFTDYINSTSSQIANYFLEHGQARLQELDDFRDVGLFMGLSGVGYSLLRSIFPEEIPSVLTLD